MSRNLPIAMCCFAKAKLANGTGRSTIAPLGAQSSPRGVVSNNLWDIFFFKRSPSVAFVFWKQKFVIKRKRLCEINNSINGGVKHTAKVMLNFIIRRDNPVNREGFCPILWVR
jgi:hypothetical protein